VHADQLPALEHAVDLTPRKPQRNELHRGDAAPLRSGQRGELRRTFCTEGVHFVPHGPIVARRV
jgi:hypothetical protein